MSLNVLRVDVFNIITDFKWFSNYFILRLCDLSFASVLRIIYVKFFSIFNVLVIKDYEGPKIMRPQMN